MAQIRHHTCLEYRWAEKGAQAALVCPAGQANTVCRPGCGCLQTTVELVKCALKQAASCRKGA
eukprot:6660239-Karenia_brevis.AAC.1